MTKSDKKGTKSDKKGRRRVRKWEIGQPEISRYGCSLPGLTGLAGHPSANLSGPYMDGFVAKIKLFSYEVVHQIETFLTYICDL